MSDTPTPAIASANQLVVRFGTQRVLDGATLTIHEGERVGLVGRNGSGKSTFLRIAAGANEPDSGEFTRRRDLVTGFLPQSFDLDDTATVHANILAGAERILELIREYERVPADSPRSAQLLDRIQHQDGYAFGWRTAARGDLPRAHRAARLPDSR
jgi:ATP-binding cassette subfamily F protein uup